MSRINASPLEPGHAALALDGRECRCEVHEDARRFLAEDGSPVGRAFLEGFGVGREAAVRPETLDVERLAQLLAVAEAAAELVANADDDYAQGWRIKDLYALRDALARLSPAEGGAQ